MHFNLAVAALTAAGLASASKPFTGFPLTNGFPAASSKALIKVQEHAGGTLPDGALPTKLTAEAVPTFQLVALQEIFEVAYFTDVLKNITNQVPGFKVKNHKYMMRAFRRIRAQEELHATGANAILASAKEKTVDGCKYVFPVTTLTEAITLANIFTDVVLGVIPQVQALVAADGGDEVGLIPLLGAILGQEGEQTGFFRAFQHKAPSAAPFLTGGAGQFAFSALKMFLVPGSCSVLPDIPSFPGITIVTTPQPMTMTLTMEVEGKVTSDMAVAYISGQHSPYMEPISDIVSMGSMTQFKVKFPFDLGFAKGLTIAAVTKSMKSFASAADVAADAVFGPGLIEVD